MIIIGEKINGTLRDVNEAIKKRNDKYISQLAIDQTEAGAHYLDVNAGTAPEKEAEDLIWLINTVQSVVDTPLCLDSPRPESLEKVISHVKRPGLINSATDETGKSDRVLKLARQHDFGVICLTMDDDGIPKDVATRLRIAKNLIMKGREFGLKDSNIYIDPLVIAVSTKDNSALDFIETVREIKQQFPEVKTVSGLSNISFGLPMRPVVNRSFMTIALYEGMDAAIMDPLNKDLMRAIFSTNILTGQDPRCRKFLSSYRSGKL